jgi:uncharacterized protein YecE (DUF72 family)
MGTAAPDRSPGTLYAGTSGFSYPDWVPRFYPPGARAGDLLRLYAQTFRTVELNNTFYSRPTESKIRTWLAATPPDFRFVVKAQRGGSMSALLRTPDESIPWLTDSLGAFGDRLGSVLFRVPDPVERDDDRLAAFLEIWPRELRLTMEFQHPSWHVDETFGRLADAGATLCATELDDDPEPPTLRLTGRTLYVRLRRTAYDEPGIAAWADRLVPFLEAGTDVFAFFRHDEVGHATEHARTLERFVAEGLMAAQRGS